jgi:hypothetical protein
MKGLLSKVGDKVGVTAKSKAPRDDQEFNELCKQLSAYTSDVKGEPFCRRTLFSF